MPYQCPYTPLELHQLNPHGFDYNHRVVLPDGRLGTISKIGYSYVWADADTGPDWCGKLAELRPATPTEIGQPRVIQLSLF
jgi:hypothetical protein